MNFHKCFLGVAAFLAWAISGTAAPVIDHIANVTIPAGKSLIIPITATSPSGAPLTYTITSSNTNAIAVVMHTNNPFWQLAVAQAATNTAPGAYQTPFRGGLVTVTNVGTMTFMLFPEYAPHTVNVFQGLTWSGFYNSNTIFHRVVSNFVIQGGDPQTNGTGGLVFQYNDEFNPEALFSGNGQLALANSGKNTDGSQFFVTLGQQRSLDFGYTIFGQLVRGFNVLTNINSTAVDANGRPLAMEVIQTASYVTNTTDTVITLTATNKATATATITVIAGDGTSFATNTFTATTATDTSYTRQPFLYPNTTVTNLVAPVNVKLTNFLGGVELEGETLGWDPQFADEASYLAITNGSYINTTNYLRNLTYNVTNINGGFLLTLAPTNNYAGPVNIYLEVYDPGSSGYYYQLYTFVFGDTPISGQTNTVTVLAASSFTNALLGNFTNGVPSSSPANFSASVNWGDDTITSGTIGTNSIGQKTVLGAHNYRFPGIYPVYVTVSNSIGASATILSCINVIDTLPSLSVISNTVATNGFGLRLQTAGLNGYVQVSTNLTSWITLTNFTATNTSILFRDIAATNSPQRFYRALVP